jgi:hypothetical protein
MAELPASFGLTVKKNDKGKAEVWGKDDLGGDYRVRQCDAAEITDTDVAEIAAVDRERTTAKEFVGNLCEDGARLRGARESAFYDDLVEGALPIAYAGLDKRGSTTGYSRAYARRFDSWIDSIKGA